MKSSVCLQWENDSEDYSWREAHICYDLRNWGLRFDANFSWRSYGWQGVSLGVQILCVYFDVRLGRMDMRAP
jgi:hypothetical protein